MTVYAGSSTHALNTLYTHTHTAHLSFFPFSWQLWMGTHSKAPSVCYSDPSCTLAARLAQNAPFYLGAVCTPSATTGELPFLFKVLSVAKALSIQVCAHKRVPFIGSACVIDWRC